MLFALEENGFPWFHIEFPSSTSYLQIIFGA